ncbi:MAG: phosphoribosylanthranilate isomerase [Acidobacteriaceae bacterium]
MWVKICGTTSLQDARLAAEAGADAVGFVFGPSKRKVTAEQVAPITCELPATVQKVGVFVNESPERIAEIVRVAGLTGVQLQGDEPLSWIAELRKLNLRLLVKTVWASSGAETLAERIAAVRGSVDGILLDSGSVAERGGTGKKFDWNEVARQLSGTLNGARIIVAGGLNPGNVETAIGTLHPWGVDVASGVESEPGKKDPAKVRAFVAAARSAGNRYEE